MFDPVGDFETEFGLWIVEPVLHLASKSVQKINEILRLSWGQRDLMR